MYVWLCMGMIVSVCEGTFMCSGCWYILFFYVGLFAFVGSVDMILHACDFVYVLLRMFVCVCICSLCVYVGRWLCMYTCVCLTFVRVCACICVLAHVCACMCVCMCMWVCRYVCLCVCIL